MFGKWFKRGGGSQAPRQLERPDQLRAGDMLEMVDSFGLPEQLRGQTLQVLKVNTYVYGSQRSSEFLLQGSSSEPIHMSFDNEDGEQSLLFTRKISRAEVESLLDMAAFGEVFGEQLYRGEISAKDSENKYSRWVGEVYHQNSDWHTAEFFEQDLRHENRQNGEFCETLDIESSDGNFFISIEVWNGGETDVSLGIARPLSDLKSYYGKTG
jgi:hypothetical protein